MKLHWPSLHYLLELLVAEKVVQHTVVTAAFAFDLFGLRNEVSLDYWVFMVSGGIVAVLFLLAFLGLVQRRRWGAGTALGLGVFDVVGEFIAQGTLFITVTLSFVVALCVIALGWRELRQATVIRT